MNLSHTTGRVAHRALTSRPIFLGPGLVAWVSALLIAGDCSGVEPCGKSGGALSPFCRLDAPDQTAKASETARDREVFQGGSRPPGAINRGEGPNAEFNPTKDGR
jgi:hypothetical protein